MIKYDFNNPEHFKALEKQAYDGTIDVTGFPPAAYRYFDSLRLLYMRYKYDNLSKEEAAAQKQQLYHQDSEATAVITGMTEAYRYYQENIRRAGTLLSRIEKSDNTADMALLSAEAISLMTGDENFIKRIKKKICKGEQS